MRTCFFGRFCLLWILLLSLCRIGEATNPGPYSDAMGDGVLHIGTCNPSGLAHKSQSFYDLPLGIYAVAETQLSQPSFQTFKRDLSFCSRSLQRDLRIQHGAFAPCRPRSSAGTWTGVAFVSDFAPRQFQLPWKSLEYSSGRMLCSSFVVGGNHVLGASIYAPPSGPTFGSTTRTVNEMLEVLTQELVCGSSGYRFIAGDFNKDPFALTTFDHWRQAGWEEVQVLAESRYSRERVPTSKKTAYSDHIWISPELSAVLLDVQVFDEVFAEHDVLVAALCLPNQKIPQFHWPTPAAFPWEDMPVMSFNTQRPFAWTDFVDDPSTGFARWSSQIEKQIVAQCQPDVVLPRGIHGRGQTRQPHKRDFTLLPAHPSRHGEESMRSDLLNRSVHRWFKQLRRLQALSQRAQRVQELPHLQADQICTWRRILQASGFSGGFQRWWQTRPHQLHGSPGQLPQFPPGAQQASLIFLDFRANYRHYEQWHLRRRQQLVKLKAYDHNKLLFRQLKDADMSPPDHFVLRNETWIAFVENGNEVTLTDEIYLSLDATWCLESTPVTLEILDSSRVRIETDLLLVPGQHLTGLQQISDFQSMDKALSSLWSPIWTKHKDLPPDAWDRALRFAEAHMPRLDFGPLVWTGDRIDVLSNKYKKRSATGPDGWSRADIAHLPPDAQQDLAEMYGHIQLTGAWPQQLITGMVCPARKTPGASEPGEFRPIILLSFLYRLWSSAASKVLLRTLATRVGAHIYGFVPGRRAQDLWYLLQAAIECAHFQQEEVVGFTLDLIKCFNYLPRAPIFAALRAMGAHAQIIFPWERALAGLERRFRLSGNIGPPHLSNVGYPEGDALSCAAMLAFNMLMDAYVQRYEESSFLTSFVGNLQLIGNSAADVQRGVLTATTFLHMMDLSLDAKKCYGWSTRPTARRELRTFGHRVRLHAKDLGAQMAFARSLSAATTEERVQSVAHFWPILARSSAPIWYKLQAVKMAAWPKALHGCENYKASFSTTQTLRSKVIQALGWRRAGASPWLRWSLMQDYDLDPEFFQLWCILRSFLRMASTSFLLQEQWNTFVSSAPLHGQGPFHSLRQALDLLGWEWLGDLSLIVGPWVFNWKDIHEALLRQLLQYSWDDFVLQQLQARRDFQGISSISRRLSFQHSGLNLGDRALLGTLQDGTFFTAWQKGKFDVTQQAFCSRCGVEDDLAHRCVTCPKYAQIHASFPQSIASWSLEPPAFTQHGLLPRNPELTHWMTYLIGLPDYTEVFHFEPMPGQTYDLFVDGSHERVNEEVSFAAWSVVSNDLLCILSQGPLHGLIQTINRAELTAVLSALRWKLRARCVLRIWSDSSYVVSNWQHLLRARHIPAHWSNKDLWNQLLLLLDVLDLDTCSIHKVSAHGDYDLATNPFDEWICTGNDRADAAAKRSNWDRGPVFDALLQAYQRHDATARRKGFAQRELLLAVARFDLNGVLPTEEVDLDECPLSELLLGRELNDCLIAAVLEPCMHTTSVIQHGQLSIDPSVLQAFAGWISSLDIAGSTKQFISLHELVIAYCIQLRAFPIRTTEGRLQKLVHPTDVFLGALARQTLAGSASVMRDLIDASFNFVQEEPPLQRRSRPLVGVLCPVWCLLVGWSVEIESVVSVALQKFSSRPMRRVQDLARTYSHIL